MNPNESPFDNTGDANKERTRSDSGAGMRLSDPPGQENNELSESQKKIQDKMKMKYKKPKNRDRNQT